jgi:hypothetical protein
LLKAGGFGVRAGVLDVTRLLFRETLTY